MRGPWNRSVLIWQKPPEVVGHVDLDVIDFRFVLGRRAPFVDETESVIRKVILPFEMKLKGLDPDGEVKDQLPKLAELVIGHG